MSKDWLDSEECSLVLNDLLSAVASHEDTRDYYLKLIEKIREHFLPKNQETYDQICDCMETADYGLKEVDYDQLRKLVLGEE